MQILEKRTGNVKLVHITTRDRLEGIQAKGLLPSEYGDLEVENNNGAGVYAIRNSGEMIQKVISNHFFAENEDLVAIYFRYDGEFYECVDEIFTKDDYEEYGEPIHKGYIVVPKTESNHFEKIFSKDIISITVVRRS